MSSTDKPASTVTEEANPKTWAILGAPSGDIEAIAFLVLMQASKSAQEDLKTIMAQVKKVNQEKSKLRELITEASMKALSSKRQELNEHHLWTLISYVMRPC